MKIIKNKSDKESCISYWGNELFELTREEIEALLNGEMLGNPDMDEYGTFIVMKKDEYNGDFCKYLSKYEDQ